MQVLEEELKRKNGVYFTVNNPFRLKPFQEWAKKIKLNEQKILEPFAGSNNIIKMLKEVNLCDEFCSYDIVPKDSEIIKRNTLFDFPIGYTTCVTNPPWLANYSAKRRSIDYPDIEYHNLYQHCLELALRHCDNVAFVIPATFLRTRLFRDRLERVILINEKIFDDTENPVCLALFGERCEDTQIYYDNNFIGNLGDLELMHDRLIKSEHKELKFNSPDGELGLFCIDNTVEPSIRFCRGEDITRKVQNSDRLITRIKGEFSNIDSVIVKLNHELKKYREKTHDVFLAPFKGLRKDGQYRRRLDYNTARGLVQNYA